MPSGARSSCTQEGVAEPASLALRSCPSEGQVMLNGGNGSNGGPSRTTNTKPLQLLQVLGNAIVGGMETYVSSLVERLPSDEFQVTCLCPYESALTASLRRRGFRIYIAPIQDDPVWRSIELAVELIRQHRIDVIH